MLAALVAAASSFALAFAAAASSFAFAFAAFASSFAFCFASAFAAFAAALSSLPPLSLTSELAPLTACLATTSASVISYSSRETLSS